MEMRRVGGALRFVLLVLMLGMGSRIGIGPVWAQEATPVTSDGATPTVLDATPRCDLADDAYTTPKNTTLSVSAPGVFANDSLAARFTVFGVFAPVHGTATVGPTGALTYTPDAGFVGSDSFQYAVVCDEGGVGVFHSAVVTVTVGDTPAVCVLADDAYSTPKGTVLSVPAPGLFDNDILYGSARLVGVLPAAHGTATVGATGGLSYTPSAGYEGSDSFTYVVTCDEGGTRVSHSAKVDITVGNAPSTCVVADDAYTTPKNTVLNVPDPGVFANDSLIPGFTSFIAASTTHGKVTVGPTGGLSYIPNAGFAGTDSFVYVAVCDEGGIGVAHTGVVTITVGDTASETACMAVDDGGIPYMTSPNGALTMTAPGVLGNDMGANPHVLFVGTSPAHGTVNLTPDGELTYTPDLDYRGGDSFTYVVGCDGTSADSVGTVRIVVGDPLP